MATFPPFDSNGKVLHVEERERGGENFIWAELTNKEKEYKPIFLS